MNGQIDISIDFGGGGVVSICPSAQKMNTVSDW